MGVGPVAVLGIRLAEKPEHMRSGFFVAFRRLSVLARLRGRVQGADARHSLPPASRTIRSAS
ncbi:hypothetical protein, partial [Calditerricola satsumensis]|uniref:hypothetical protein n=1 Tax=Calditerricola satsumensis TaxID=373054 RepID=UPI001C47D281